MASYEPNIMIDICKCCINECKALRLRPKCGFKQDGTFNEDNWNCLILNAVRNNMRKAAGVRFNEHQMMLDCFEDAVISMRWTKYRGRVTEAKIVFDDHSEHDKDLDVYTAYMYLREKAGYLEYFELCGTEWEGCEISYEDFMKHAESESLIPEWLQ